VTQPVTVTSSPLSPLLSPMTQNRTGRGQRGDSMAIWGLNRGIQISKQDSGPPTWWDRFPLGSRAASTSSTCQEIIDLILSTGEYINIQRMHNINSKRGMDLAMLMRLSKNSLCKLEDLKGRHEELIFPEVLCTLRTPSLSQPLVMMMRKALTGRNLLPPSQLLWRPRFLISVINANDQIRLVK
jgi:hypothetical protein